MANPNDAIFEIDAGKILAKLHLAGQQAIPNAIPINTGIVNPVAKADPSKPGNVEFNLDNKSGQYEFGVLKLLSYQVPIDVSKNKKLADLYKKLEKAKEKDKKAGKDAYADAKLTAKTKDEDSKDAKPEKVDKNSETYKVQQEILKEFASYKLSNYKENKDDFNESTTSFKEAVKAENTKRQETKKQNQDKLQKDAYQDIKTYFETISGQQNASKIKQTDIVIRNADVDGKIKDPTQFKNIKDFKITTDNIDKEIKKHEQNIQETKPNEPITRNILCLVGFNVEIETM